MKVLGHTLAVWDMSRRSPIGVEDGRWVAVGVDDCIGRRGVARAVGSLTAGSCRAVDG